MKIIFFGTPDFAVPSLQALIDSGEEIVAVITQPDRLKGRGHKLSQPPVKEYALFQGIPLLQPASIKTPGFYEEISAFQFDSIVVVAYGKIMPASLLKLPRFGCINVHASLLPAYRGAAPVQWALINGELKTGITTMRMDEGMDTGDIFLQEEVEIHPEDDALTLSERLSEVGAALLVRTLKGVQDMSVKPIPQSGSVSYAPPLKKENGRINWSLAARDISNLVRGTYPWPGAYSFLGGEKILILKARSVRDGDKYSAAGRIVKVSADEIFVGAGEGLIAISEVKPEGKKMMTAPAFMNGRHLKLGTTFDTL
jgi:methionyl-tRNA formyltransferase